MDIFTKKRSAGFLIALLVALDLVLSVTLWIHCLRPPYPDRPSPPERREAEIVDFFVAELSLTPQQEIILRALQKQFFIRMDSIQREVNELRRQIIDQSFNDSPDIAKVEAMADEIGPKEAQKEQLLFEHFREIKQICGPEQEKKLKSLVQELSKIGGPPGPPPPPPSGCVRGAAFLPHRLWTGIRSSLL